MVDHRLRAGSGIRLIAFHIRLLFQRIKTTGHAGPENIRGNGFRRP
jgi:hypothetical protein